MESLGVLPGHPSRSGEKDDGHGTDRGKLVDGFAELGPHDLVPSLHRCGIINDEHDFVGLGLDPHEIGGESFAQDRHVHVHAHVPDVAHRTHNHARIQIPGLNIDERHGNVGNRLGLEGKSLRRLGRLLPLHETDLLLLLLRGAGLFARVGKIRPLVSGRSFPNDDTPQAYEKKNHEKQ